MSSWELSYMKENIFKNSIKFDLPKTDIKPILKNATDKDIGTKISIGMPKDEPIFKKGEDIER